MGKVVTKTAIVSILKKYNFECADDRELVIANHSLTLAIEGGINVKISNRQD